MERMVRGRLVWMTAGLIVVGAAAARADAIDGHWCFTDGKRISIQGPAIVTPAGSRIQGDYARHFFSYVVPEADPGAGQTVSMTLLNEDTVRLRIGTAAAPSYDGPGEIWHRCGPPTS
jgi:hypothetical protein